MLKLNYGKLKDELKDSVDEFNQNYNNENYSNLKLYELAINIVETDHIIKIKLYDKLEELTKINTK